MKKLILVTLLLTGCTQEKSLLEIEQSLKHKVGDKVTISHGFYRGCVVTVKSWRVIRHSWDQPTVQYLGDTSCINKPNQLGFSYD